VSTLRARPVSAMPRLVQGTIAALRNQGYRIHIVFEDGADAHIIVDLHDAWRTVMRNSLLNGCLLQRGNSTCWH